MPPLLLITPTSQSLTAVDKMSLLSPSVLVTPPMRATQAVGDKDETLEALMEDYIRATELQLSLKKRIDAVIKVKEEQAEQEEESARIALEAAELKTARLREANQLFKERMRKAAGIEDDENTSSIVPVSTSPISVRTIPIELPQPGTPGRFSVWDRPSPPLQLRSRSITPPVYVMPSPAPVVQRFDRPDAMMATPSIGAKKKKAKKEKVDM
ncbi:hypothetical protein FRB91_004262 [Serendipita sp. 411]|nr:hypothetical protein FRC18_004370 [Serendipita sp. 400]KAG8842329.1 hypothetical protein FRB91_004262 [Serendipita sp. 411]